MKKAAMEAHHAEYGARMSAARTAERDGLYREAMSHALSAWEFIDGMMQYAKRYEERSVDSVSAIDLVLRYAPLLLDRKSLDTLEGLLKEYRRIERDVEADMGGKLAKARANLWENHRLWAHLETNGDVRQDELRRHLGGEQERWRAVSEAWEAMGLVHRRPEGGSYRVELSTRLGQVVKAKCPRCGKAQDAPKAMFLEELACPKCHRKVEFVLLVGIAT
jgi:hypothetical protein